MDNSSPLEATSIEPNNRRLASRLVWPVLAFVLILIAVVVSYSIGRSSAQARTARQPQQPSVQAKPGDNTKFVANSPSPAVSPAAANPGSETPAKNADETTEAANLADETTAYETIPGWRNEGVKLLQATFSGSSATSGGGHWLKLKLQDGTSVFLPGIDFLQGGGNRLLMIFCTPGVPPTLGITDALDSEGSVVKLSMLFDDAKLSDTEHEEWVVQSVGLPLLMPPSNPKTWAYRIAHSRNLWVGDERVWAASYSTTGIDYGDFNAACGLPN